MDVEHKYQKGVILLTLGWFDGYSFVAVGFNLLSSAKKSNRYQEISDKIDRRNNGYKTRKESLLAKPDAALLLIQRALNAGIKADCVLMDTWFTTEPLIRSILAEGLDAIGMVKQLTPRYNYKGMSCTLPDTEIVRIYGDRWSIECFFKASKSFLKPGTEFQSHTYDAMVSHTAIVFTRYTILEWVRRNKNDEKPMANYFSCFVKISLTNTLQSLMALFAEYISTLSADITACIKSKVIEWMNSQTAFIQALFGNICWES